MSALQNWKEAIIGTARLLSNRLFDSFKSGICRIEAHLSGVSVVIVSLLRREKSSEKYLPEIMHTDNFASVASMVEKGNYCLDMTHSYLIEAERPQFTDASGCLARQNEHWLVMYYCT